MIENVLITLLVTHAFPLMHSRRSIRVPAAVLHDSAGLFRLVSSLPLGKAEPEYTRMALRNVCPLKCYEQGGSLGISDTISIPPTHSCQKPRIHEKKRRPSRHSGSRRDILHPVVGEGKR